MTQRNSVKKELKRIELDPELAAEFEAELGYQMRVNEACGRDLQGKATEEDARILKAEGFDYWGWSSYFQPSQNTESRSV